MNGVGEPECGSECQEALAELEAYLDGELPADRLDEVRRHLRECYPCTDRASFEEQLRAIVRRDCVEHAPASLTDRIVALLDDGLGEVEAPGTAGIATGGADAGAAESS